VHAARDIAGLAALARILDRPAVAVSDGAVGWYLFAAMIHAAEIEGCPLAFVFDAGETAGPAIEALRAGARHVLSEVEGPQWHDLADLAQAMGTILLDRLPYEPLRDLDLEAMKTALLGRRTPA